MIVAIILILLGFVLLIKGADFLVDGASSIAKKFHIPEIVIGLTIVSIGTSMPELIVSCKSALEGHSDITIGTVVGSNLANLFLILGTCALIKPLRFEKQTRLFENPFNFIVTILLFVLANTNQTVSRIEGIVLLTLAVGFIIYNMIMAKKGAQFDVEEGNEPEEEEEIKEMPTWKSILAIILGIIGLKFGGDFVVDNAEYIAAALGMSEKLISLTVIAFSTSLPELITSIVATKRGETDMAIGNILGSQIFNILLIIGSTATIAPITYSILYNKDLILLSMGAVLLALFPYIGTKNKMTRSNGSVYVIIYTLYILSLVIYNR